MNLGNFFKTIGMFLNKEVRKFFKEEYNLVKNDPNFSIKNALKSRYVVLKGEKIVKHEGKYIVSSASPPIPSVAFSQLVKSTPDKEKIYTQQMLAQNSAPISFNLALTYNCEYDCKHCSAKERRKGKELSTKQWIPIIQSIQEMGTSMICFTGGEPLLRKDLEEIISAVDERSVSLLYTCGKGLTYEKAKSLKEKGLFFVAVSFDSPNEADFNEFRGDDNAFQNSINALINCRKAGLYTIMQAVLRRQDVSKKYLLEFLRLGKKLKIHEFRILQPIKSGKLFYRDNREDIFFDEKTRHDLIKLQYKINRRLRFPKVASFPDMESDLKFGCGAGIQHSYITPLGELIPCDFVPLSFGNVLEKNVEILWKEMKAIIGLPKSGCFANTINEELQTCADEVFPLDRNKSEEIFVKHQSRTYPKYYLSMQGKKQKI
jgi:MoaA/NifB/PqqE/SkfB family radical SAM enzyme